MTREELKTTIDNYLGLVGKLGEGHDERKIFYKSPTGVELFNLTIGDYGQGWQFGGNSGALPESWEFLCHIHKGGR